MNLILDLFSTSTVLRLFKSGFFHIFSSQFLNKVIAGANSIFIVRFLSQEDFGIYSYANNIISMFLLFNGLGAISGYLQIGCENIDNPAKVAAIGRYSWKFGMGANIIITLAVIVYALSGVCKIKESIPVLVALSFLPLAVYAYSHLEIGFRIRLQSQAFSWLSLSNGILLMVLSIGGAWLWSVFGLVGFRYLAYVLSIGIGIWMCCKLCRARPAPAALSRNDIAAFKKISIISTMNNGLSQSIYLVDVFIIGLLLPSEIDIAVYKTATLIPFAMLFLPMVVIIYVYPYFSSHNTDAGWQMKHSLLLLAGLTAANFFISLAMIILAPFIVRILFGAEYDSCVPIFRILFIGYFFAASFRIPFGNLLVTLRKLEFNLVVAIISGAGSIGLNFLLIGKFGIIGAAWTSVVIFIVTSVLNVWYYFFVIRNARKMQVCRQ